MYGVNRDTIVFRRQMAVVVVVGATTSVLAGTTRGFAAHATPTETAGLDLDGLFADRYLVTALATISILTVFAIALVALTSLAQHGTGRRRQLRHRPTLMAILGLSSVRDSNPVVSGFDVDLTGTAGGVFQSAFAGSPPAGRRYSMWDAGDRGR